MLIFSHHFPIGWWGAGPGQGGSEGGCRLNTPFRNNQTRARTILRAFSMVFQLFSIVFHETRWNKLEIGGKSESWKTMGKHSWKKRNSLRWISRKPRAREAATTPPPCCLLNALLFAQFAQCMRDNKIASFDPHVNFVMEKELFGIYSAWRVPYDTPKHNPTPSFLQPLHL